MNFYTFSHFSCIYVCNRGNALHFHDKKVKKKVQTTFLDFETQRPRERHLLQPTFLQQHTSI